VRHVMLPYRGMIPADVVVDTAAEQVHVAGLRSESVEEK